MFRKVNGDLSMSLSGMAKLQTLFMAEYEMPSSKGLKNYGWISKPARGEKGRMRSQ